MRKPLVRPQHLPTATVLPLPPLLPPVPVKPAPPATNARKLQLPPLSMPPPQPHGLRHVQFQQPSTAMPPVNKLPASAPMARPPAFDDPMQQQQQWHHWQQRRHFHRCRHLCRHRCR